MLINFNLAPLDNILIWSDSEHVHIEWDNRDRHFDGKPAWSAVLGSYAIPRDQFIEEIKSFHVRLMDQMAARVDQILNATTPLFTVMVMAAAGEEKPPARRIAGVIVGLIGVVILRGWTFGDGFWSEPGIGSALLLIDGRVLECFRRAPSPCTR